MIKPEKLSYRMVWLAIAGWSLLLFGSAAWNLHHTIQQSKARAVKEARTVYNKTLGTISWVAIHGGVYVPATEMTEPNPLLAHIPERDITTPSGKKLTLMNSAYMLRQMSQVFEKLYGIKGHITSLKNVRPETAPDTWEISALQRFEKGAKEVLEFNDIDGKSFLRLMKPLYVKKACLKCHGWQNYKVGDVRGGISVSLPMEVYFQAQRESAFIILGSHFLIWLIGAAGLFYMGRRLTTLLGKLKWMNETLQSRVEEESEKRIKQEELLIQQSKMASMGEMLGAIAHQWKQPLNALSLTVEDIKDAYDYGELTEEYLEKSIRQSKTQIGFMEETIQDFRNFLKPTKEKERFMACESMEEVYGLIKAQMKGHGITLTVKEHEHFHVLGYPNEFKQVVLNLFNNARDAINESGNKAGHITVVVDNDGTTGSIRIMDNGGGIPEALLPDKLFQPYLTTKGEAGTGIGLHICKTIIEDHMDGTITARNTEEGAEFLITLPIVSGE